MSKQKRNRSKAQPQRSADGRAVKPATFARLKPDITSAHHDVFVSTKAEADEKPRVYRFVVNKEDGVYDTSPFELSAAGANYQKFSERRVSSLLEQDSCSGAAFATLPVKEEPASVAGSCYLINRQLLNFNNVWTRAPWNDSPNDLQQKGQHIARFVTEEPANPQPRFLLALNTGEVLDIQITRSRANSPRLQASVLDLHGNPDVWRLLRNGCVAGVAVHDDGEKLPLFSLASVHTQPINKRRKRSTEITGTLDYKWRPGSTIKVKFTGYDTEKFYGRDRSEVISEIEMLANTWLENANLQFAFDSGQVDEINDDYDILVSLAPLVKGGPEGIRGHMGLVPGASEPEEVLFPKSLLGCYAEREERNVPTMFLGYPESLRDPFTAEGEVIPRKKYFASRAFKHIVLHEFGHALGLPHLYQHPGLRRNPFFKPSSTKASITNRLKKCVGPTFDTKYVDEDLKNRWPDATYSEWPKIPKGQKDAQTFAKWMKTSVMIGIPARALLAKDNELLPLRDSLGTTDKQWINLLYPK